MGMVFIMRGLVRKIALKLAKGKTMSEITNLIMTKCTIDENGKLWSPSGKCIGWYNAETCTGWCNLKGYRELKKLPPTDDEKLYDEVDLTEFLDEEDIAVAYDEES